MDRDLKLDMDVLNISTFLKKLYAADMLKKIPKIFRPIRLSWFSSIKQFPFIIVLFTLIV